MIKAPSKKAPIMYVQEWYSWGCMNQGFKHGRRHGVPAAPPPRHTCVSEASPCHGAGGWGLVRTRQEKSLHARHPCTTHAVMQRRASKGDGPFFLSFLHTRKACAYLTTCVDSCLDDSSSSHTAFLLLSPSLETFRWTGSWRVIGWGVKGLGQRGRGVVTHGKLCAPALFVDLVCLCCC